METKAVKKTLWQGIGFSFALISLVAALFAWQVVKLLDLAGVVAHSEAMIADTLLIEKLFVDMESGNRGFLLTNKPEFLEPFYKARAEVLTHLAKVRQEVKNDPSQVQQVKKIEDLAQEWLSSRLSHIQGNAAADEAYMLQGKRLMDEIRATVAKLAETEQAHKKARQDEVTNAARASFAVTGLIALLFAGIVSFGTFRLIRRVSESYQRTLDNLSATSAALRDVNDNLETKVRERTLALTASNQELEAFSYSVSHDLRAPLRGVDGFSKALIEDYGPKLDDDGRQYLKFIRDGVQKMGHLIDDLLSLSRLTRAEMTVGPVDLTKEAKIITQRLERDGDLKAEIKIQPGLKAEGDSGLLAACLENLLSNAVKFSSKKERPMVEFGQTDEKGYPVFYVKDNGAGFDMTYYDKLFGAFQRLHSAKDFQGTGVGLATVRRIIQRHGGKVWANSKVGEGTTFYFTLNEGASA